jgi:hypothetical protein
MLNVISTNKTMNSELKLSARWYILSKLLKKLLSGILDLENSHYQLSDAWFLAYDPNRESTSLTCKPPSKTVIATVTPPMIMTA